MGPCNKPAPPRHLTGVTPISSGPSKSTSTPLRQQVQQACQELCRRIRAGAGGSAEELLAEHPQIALNSEAALELIYTEFLQRQDQGEETNPQQWIERF